jgi:segregation and condensation protein B
MSDEPILKRIVEAILFASQRPISMRDLQGILKGAAEANKADPGVAAFGGIKAPVLGAAIEELRAECANRSCAYELRESAAGFQLVTKAAFAPWLRQLFPEYRSARLSAPALETLAIIAYRQPITRADIEAVRGVTVDGVLQTLLDRGLVKIAGRAEIPGRPLLYETTQHFMDHFGLRNLDELPNSEELRRMALPEAPAQAGARRGEPKPPDDGRKEAGMQNPAIFQSGQTEKPS